jgi:hypothetical protein
VNSIRDGVNKNIDFLQISKAHVSRVEGRRTVERMPVLTIEYSDFQDVQVINDRMNAARYILSSNIGICSKAKAKVLHGHDVELFLDELKQQSVRVENLLERAKSGSSLVRHSIVTIEHQLISEPDAGHYIVPWPGLLEDEQREFQRDGAAG